MFWWIFWGVYALTFVGTYRETFKVFYDTPQDCKDPWGRVGSASLSGGIALFGPVILPFVLGYKLLTPVTERDKRERKQKLEQDLYELEVANGDQQKKRSDQWLERQIDEMIGTRYDWDHATRRAFKTELTKRIKRGDFA